jgi:hypothetical protein
MTITEILTDKVLVKSVKTAMNRFAVVMFREFATVLHATKPDLVIDDDAEELSRLWV